MAHLSKTTKTVVIAAAVLLVLGVVMLVLLLTQPKEGDTSSAPVASTVDTSVVITDYDPEHLLSAKITNETGSFTFVRNERIVSSTDDDGNVSSKTEYYYDSEELKGLSPNNTTLSAFMKCLARLSTKSLVEQNAPDLDKYGLKDPDATAVLTFDDGREVTMCFGIKNPANTAQVYFCLAGTNDVHLVSYYSIGDVYYEIEAFVNLVATPSYVQGGNELQELKIERKDFDEPVIIRYMQELDSATDEDEITVTSFNTHRLTSPVSLEVDVTLGKAVVYGVYGLSFSSCEYLEQTEEALAATGLDDPYAKVTFRYGGEKYVLLLGSEIIESVETEDENTPTLTTVTGYYACLEGGKGIFAIAKGSAPWYSFSVGNIVSRRPFSPYIYTVTDIDITAPDGDYHFDIEGTVDSHKFLYGETELDDLKFREFYQHAIAAIGEELCTDEPETELYVSITFTYAEGYADKYGTDKDSIEFYKSGDRKYLVVVNGKPIFKVREIYIDRLIDNIDALLNGGDIELNW